MHTFFFLYALTYVPVSGAGQYAPALDKAREAAFVQSGIAQDWHKARAMAEKQVPEDAKKALALYNVVRKQEIKIKSHAAGDWTVRKDSVEVKWGFEW